MSPEISAREHRRLRFESVPLGPALSTWPAEVLTAQIFEHDILIIFSSLPCQPPLSQFFYFTVPIRDRRRNTTSYFDATCLDPRRNEKYISDLAHYLYFYSPDSAFFVFQKYLATKKTHVRTYNFCIGNFFFFSNKRKPTSKLYNFDLKTICKITHSYSLKYC